MQAGWTSHEDRLRLMESLSCQLEDICSDIALSSIREAVHAVGDDLVCLQLKCSQIVEHLDRHRQSLGSDSHKQILVADDGDTAVNTCKRFAIKATYFAKSFRFLFGKLKGSTVLVGGAWGLELTAEESSLH